MTVSNPAESESLYFQVLAAAPVTSHFQADLQAYNKFVVKEATLGLLQGLGVPGPEADAAAAKAVAPPMFAAGSRKLLEG